MQQRMTFADNWNTLAHACLASAVRLLGDRETNWSTVCNYLKSKFALVDRPGNWLTPESCEAQYKWLSDKYVRMEISCERPVNQILQNLKQIGECESKPVLEQENTYKELKKRLELFAKNEVDSEIVMEFYEDSCKRNREREENMKKHGVKNDSPTVTKSLKPDNKTDGTSPTTTSPLLSSLLNNPPAVQYRPTLQTGSFIPNKTTQGTSRTSFERGHTPDGSQRGAYSPNVGSQPSPLSERPSSFTTSAVLPARKLDFQDPSTSATSHDHQQTNKDVAWNEPAKSDAHNLEKMNLIPTVEEFDPDILYEVIENLQGKQALEKVLDVLTGEKEAIIEKDLNTVTIPLDDTFVANSPAAKSSVQVLTVPIESKTSAVTDTSAMNAEFESLAGTEDVIIIDEESSSEQVIDNTNIAGVEQPTPTDAASVNPEATVASLTMKNVSESTSESKFDAEPLVEYLDESSVEKPDDRSAPSEEKPDVKQEIGNTEVCKVNDEGRELMGDYESSHGIPQTAETRDAPASGEQNITESSCTEVEQPTTESVDVQVEEAKEVPTESATKENDVPIATKLKDTFDLENIPVNEYEPTDKYDTTKTEIDQSRSVQEEAKSEQVTKTEEAAAEPSKISKPILETEQTVDSPAPILPSVVEEPVSTAAEEKPVDVKVGTPSDVNEVHETEKAASKNRRQLPRRRRSTASESNETPKITKILVTERTQVEEVDAKKAASVKESVNDSQVETLDSEVFVKTEVVEEPTVPVEQTSPTKTKSTSQSSDAKRSKTKPSTTTLNRRSSIRSQQQNPPVPKSEEPLASPSTSSSSRMSDSAAVSKCRRSLVLSQQRLASQKYSSAFLKPISNKTVAGYDELIYNPVDLHTIKKKIDTKVMTTVTEFERDVLLMILNAKMFNRMNPQVYNMAVEMQKEALREIQLTVKTLGEGVLLEVEDDITEKARKRQAVENPKKDQKSNKRSKPSIKDEGMPAKKPKLEENESTS